jgi:peptide/nickel transport system substrate-binding protein
LALVLITAGAACGGGDDGSDGADSTQATTATTAPAEVREGGKLVYGIITETNSWNPALGQWSPTSWAVGTSIFDTIAYWDEDFQVHPFLAESITPDDRLRVWTIKLREGITFHNGEPLDAEAVKLNVDTYRESPLLGPAMRAITGVEVVDPLTVQIELVGPWAEFPHGLASQAGIMMAPEMIKDPDGGTRPIGTGPFVFEEWAVDDRLVVRKNEDYWMGEPHLDEIEFQVIVDNSSRRNALESGDVDAIETQTPRDIMDLQENSAFRVDIASAGEDQENFLLMNQLKPPFDDPRAREALIRAVDNEGLVDTLFDGFFEPADGMYPAGSPWHAETTYPGYDPDGARALVEDYEAETGEPLRFELGGPPTDISLQIRQAIAEQAGQVGMEVELTSTEQTQFIASTVTGDYQASIWTYHGAPHPDAEYPFLHGGFAAPEGQLGLNFARNDDPEMNALLNEARAERDPDEQKRLYDQIQQRHAEDFVYVWLWHVKQAVVSRTAIHDLTEWTLPDGEPGAPLQQLRHHWHQVWIE